jgi:hypothetical protein
MSQPLREAFSTIQNINQTCVKLAQRFKTSTKLARSLLNDSQNHLGPQKNFAKQKMSKEKFIPGCHAPAML